MPRSGQDRPHHRLAPRAGLASSAQPGPTKLIGAAATIALLLGLTSGTRAQSEHTNLPDDHPVQIQRRATTARKAPARVLDKNRPTAGAERPVAAQTPPPAAETAPAPAPPPSATPAPAVAPAPGTPPPAQAAAPAVATPPPPKLEAAGLVQADEAAALKADVAERLKALTAPPDAADPKAETDPAAKLASKALQDELQERQKRLDDYDKVAKELKDLNNPASDPAGQLAEVKDELAGIQEQLKRPTNDLLPAVFGKEIDKLDDADRAQMKEAIEAAKKEVAEFQGKLQNSSPEPVKEAGKVVINLRTERDKIAQRVAALKARSEGNATAPAAKSPADRSLAEEKATNLRIELTAETLRAQAMELKIARTAKSAEVAAARRTAWIDRQKLGRNLLIPMQNRSRLVAEADERKLKQQASDEEAKAAQLKDPLARYKAGRSGDLLNLKASAVRFEQLVTAGTTPSLEDVRGLAARASANLVRIKQLLDEGRFSQYDAILLNADYRSIDPERDRVRRNELAVIEKWVRDCTNMLTSAELELIEDGLVDQVELDNLLDSLPPERHAEAQEVVVKLEAEHRVLLTRRRDALRLLFNGATETLGEINGRLDTLDEEYNYIRTHLFWIRDQEPVALATIGRGVWELKRLATVSLRLAEETATPKSWRRLTPEFLAAALVSVVLPAGLFRFRGVLKRRLLRALPPSQLHGDPARTVVKVDMNPVAQ